MHALFVEVSKCHSIKFVKVVRIFSLLNVVYLTDDLSATFAFHQACLALTARTENVHRYAKVGTTGCFILSYF